MYALQGLKIVDFGIFFAGPYAAKLLADLGADVIKVEAVTGDPMRRSMGPFIGCQRNKRSLAVDLKNPDGQAVVHKLFAQTDIVCHNMRPGVAERLGIGYEDVKRFNPGVIYMHSPSFGTIGPRKDQPGFEPLVGSMVGMGIMSGGKGNNPVNSVANMDYGNGQLGAIGLLMALIHRAKTGQGQKIECPQMVSGMITTSELYWKKDGTLSEWFELDQRQTGYGPLCRIYETKSDEWICIVVAKEKDFQALCKTIGVPGFASDARFATKDARKKNAAALSAELEKLFKARSAAEWFKILDAAGVPCEISEMKGPDKLFSNPEHIQSGLVSEYSHPQFGTMREVGQIIRLSETPGNIWGPAPMAGQHTRDILTELGYARSAQDDLKTRGIVNWPIEERAKVGV